MREKVWQSVGILWTLLFAAVVVWLYNTAPRSLADVTTGAQVAVGTYEIDQTRFRTALDLFRREQYAAARDEFRRADPATKDARTQFYIAYAFYREGWGRFYNDDALFRKGLLQAELVSELAAPDFRIDDADLKIKTPAELKAEFQNGLQTSLSDLNPLKVIRERK